MNIPKINFSPATWYETYLDGVDWTKFTLYFGLTEGYITKLIIDAGYKPASMGIAVSISSALVTVCLLVIAKKYPALSKNIEAETEKEAVNVQVSRTALANAKQIGAATVDTAKGVAVDAVNAMADAADAAATKSEPVTPLPSFAATQAAASSATTVPNAADVILAEAPAMIAAGEVKILPGETTRAFAPITDEMQASPGSEPLNSPRETTRALDVSLASPEAADSLAMQTGSKAASGEQVTGGAILLTPSERQSLTVTSGATLPAADVPETAVSPSAVNVASDSGTVAAEVPVVVAAPPPAPEPLAATPAPTELSLSDLSKI